MEKSTSLRIAGVPEAFNDVFDEAPYAESGIQPNPTFVSHGGGSGAMLKSLVAGEVDAAYMLTDCVIAGIENGQPVRLAGAVVKSPLRWGVITKAGSQDKLTDLRTATWGVSRMGSGSHVMVRVIASEKGWPTPDFHVCGAFQGLRDAVSTGVIDAFLWEYFTTRPFAQAGEVSIIDVVPTPWGAFSLAVQADCNRLSEVRAVTNAFLGTAANYVRDGACAARVSARHGMTEDDARAWALQVTYAKPGDVVSARELHAVRAALRQAGVISKGSGEGEGEGEGEGDGASDLSWYSMA